MSSKPRKYVKKPFESTGKSSDVSANIYESMILSPAWKSLTPKQKELYVICKLQLYSEKKPPKAVGKPDNEALFTMNRHKYVKKYGLYKDNNRAGFHRDMNALIDKGFIDLVQSGKTNRTKSIYALSSRWQDYVPDKETINR